MDPKTALAKELIALRSEIEQMTPSGQDRAQLFGDVALAVLDHGQVDLESSHRLIRRIARNKRIDMIRRARFRSHQSLETLSAPLIAAPLAVVTSLDELIAHLPADDQAFLQARFRDNKSWVEIAKETNLPEPTVRSRWHRLKQRLAQDDVLRRAINHWT